MADQSLVESKVEASKKLVQKLVNDGLALVAAYWDWREERGGWVLFIVAQSFADERKLIAAVSALKNEMPFRQVFSLGDVIVDSHQIERARALGAYIRIAPFEGRRIDTTFTGGHYFEGAIPIYLREDLLTHLHVA
ncbi:MAG: hypothetical protein WDO17_20600 [Alphaproteobacteria bacterium]